MHQLLWAVMAVVVATAAGTSVVVAQSICYGLGGGLIVPTSDYAKLDKTGWHVMGKLDVGIPLSPLGVRVDGMYGQTSHKAPLTGTTKLGGGTAGLVWHIRTAVPGFKPYLLGSVGVYNVNRGSSETKFAWGGGVGTALGVGPVHSFAEARYVSVQTSGTSLKFIPVTVGLSFGS